MHLRYQLLVVALCVLVSACEESASALDSAKLACTYGDPPGATAVTQRVALELADKAVPADDAAVSEAYDELVREVGPDADVIARANEERLNRSVAAATRAAASDSTWGELRDTMKLYAEWIDAGAPGADDPAQVARVNEWYETTVTACERANAG